MKQQKKTGKHMFFSGLKLLKKRNITPKTPAGFTRNKKTAKITTINNDFFAVTGKVVSQGMFFGVCST